MAVYNAGRVGAGAFLCFWQGGEGCVCGEVRFLCVCAFRRKEWGDKGFLF